MANHKAWPLAVYVLVGCAVGAAYVAFDLVSEAKLQAHTLTGALSSAHSLVDHLLPMLSGGLLGLSVYHLRWRARLAAAEESASRAEALRTRLLKVERDQAVWVVAAAVLHEVNIRSMRLACCSTNVRRVWVTNRNARSSWSGRTRKCGAHCLIWKRSDHFRAKLNQKGTRSTSIA